jgi:hypothetical protein
METPLLFSVSAKLGALGDFRTADFNPLRNETATESGLLASILRRRVLEIGLGRKLLIILIESERRSSGVSASTFCRRRIEPSCFSLVELLVFIPLAPFVSGNTSDVPSMFSILPGLCNLPSGGLEELSNLSSSELPFLYKDISVLQSMSSLL